MKIKYTKSAAKYISQMDTKTKLRIKQAVENIPQGDIKPLRGCGVLNRLRVGDKCIIFSYPDNDTVLVEKIAPRGDVYKGGH